MALLLVADDEPTIRNMLQTIFKYANHEVELAANGLEALETLRTKEIDVAFLDIKMPGMEGIEVLQKARPICPETVFVVMSAHATVQHAVEATRQGAFEFVEKPLDRERILLVLRNAVASRQLSRENRAFRTAFQRDVSILGESKAIKDVIALVAKVAPTDARVLITGENGTGKELVARAVHLGSRRAKGAFVAVNCAALPATLIESELFGHEQGSFTGATQMREGKFQAADGGTLFLDEIGDMPVEAQAKLLRTLEEGSIIRIGSNTPIKVDVRVLAATNQDIALLIKKGAFREDLFFRLNVFPIQVPPLRQRKDDIPLLAGFFMQEFCRKNGIQPRRIEGPALDLLRTHDWPGNVRELRNFLERISIIAEGDVIDAPQMEKFLGSNSVPSAASFGRGTYDEFRELTDRLFLETRLRQNHFNISHTALELGVNRPRLYRMLTELGLRKFAQEGAAAEPESGDDE